MFTIYSENIDLAGDDALVGPFMTGRNKTLRLHFFNLEIWASKVDHLKYSLKKKA
jgi:hypothetical protein